MPLARKFNVDHGCNVFMLSYRGYGESEGHPHEAGGPPPNCPLVLCLMFQG